MAPRDSNGNGVVTPAAGVPDDVPPRAVGPSAAAVAAQALLVSFVRAKLVLIEFVETGGLQGLTEVEQVRFAQDFERAENQSPLVHHAVIAEAQRSGLADRLGQRNVQTVLVQALRISPAEATRRVRAAAAVGLRETVLGEKLEPVWPHLAAGQRSGEVSAEQVGIVERVLHHLDRPGLDHSQVEDAEELLAGYALTFGPQELRRIGERIADHVNPDGTFPDDQLTRDRRHLQLTLLRDGSYKLEGRLTPALGAQLTAVLGPLSKPRIATVELEDGREVQETDERTHGQRQHDALEDVCARLLRVGGLPASGGTPATVIVTIDEDSLRNRTGHGTSTDGTHLPVADVLRLANEADILPAVLSASGVLLDLGRSRRVANQNQTMALILRDKGCSFPGCSHPPEYCDRHHIQEWSQGGKTDLTNLTLLCRYHHTHFLGSGWTCRMNADHLPEWRPPTWVDPAQKPLINDRIRATRAPVT